MARLETNVVDKRRDWGNLNEILPLKDVKEVEYAAVDVKKEIEEFPLVPSAGRIYVIQAEVEKAKGLWVPSDKRKDGEMQTNIGWVIAVASDVEFCKPGDRVFYGMYSGAWVMDQKYRVMNEVDILGKFKNA